MKTNNETYLIVNPGSTSICYLLYKNGKEIAYAYFLNRFSSYEVLYRSESGEKNHIISQQDFEQSGQLFFNYIQQQNISISFAKIGVRVVAPGTFFTQHRPIDETFLKELIKIEHVDPLHIKPLLQQIKNLKKLMPNIPLYGLSDSAFHVSMSSYAKTYALPQEIMAHLDIHRFGYHGLACSSIMRKITKNYEQIPENIIMCHLGGGTSVTAVKNGASFDTTMGYSPLEGLPMATRSGNIDPNALLQIMHANNFNGAQARNFLYTKCGLLALSGLSGDMRQIEAAYNNGNVQCEHAINYYVYAITKAIGAYVVLLGGIDLLVLTGGISTHLPFIRTLICDKLTIFKAKIAPQKSATLVEQDGFIHASDSNMHIAVFAPDEEEEMYEILRGDLSKLR